MREYILFSANLSKYLGKGAAQMHVKHLMEKLYKWILGPSININHNNKFKTT
jgi:hypothetical protein